MAINYPNGQKYQNPKHDVISRKSFSAAKRGMTLEDELNQANSYYLATNRAVIHKKPTPVQIVHVDYPARSVAKITEAYFREASTTDYNGVYQGNYIDFDAKETANKNSFPLSNVHEHQVNHLKQVVQQDGLAFMIIRFTKRQETFVIWAQLLFDYWDNQEHARKSIPYDVIAEQGQHVNLGLNPALPYLDAIDQLRKQR
ncbi:recombination protein U [Weissella uvarum]|uniref:Holliday junction resolvase RecU n=1 Tax=Weissella uvarum TaxID=1479233 RepID=UPI00195F9C73|nr:recombination protein U [Weissella uvarum]MCM0595660.1 Holliday junction resolvase RecU [Weissella uvarum]